MSSNEILIQCQAKVSNIYLYILVYVLYLVIHFRTTFFNALWTEIFETSDARNMI